MQMARGSGGPWPATKRWGALGLGSRLPFFQVNSYRNVCWKMPSIDHRWTLRRKQVTSRAAFVDSSKLAQCAGKGFGGRDQTEPGAKPFATVAVCCGTTTRKVGAMRVKRRTSCNTFQVYCSYGTTMGSLL